MGWKKWVYGDLVSATGFQSYVQDQTIQRYADSATRTSTLGTAVAEGMVSYLDSTNAVEVYDGSSWGSLGGSGTTNLIINGAFDVWQRGTSFTYTTVFNYTADRWMIICNGTGAYTASQQTFTAGTAPVSGYEGKNFLRLNVTSMSGATATGIFQRIEDVRTFAGQTITVSFWAKADAARTVTPQLAQIFGTGGSTAVTTTGTGVALTTSWARYTQTFTVPSVSSKTITSDSSLELGFMVPLNTVETIDIWGVQLESGSSATPFKRNAPSIQGELAACQRYFNRTVYDGSAKLVGTGIVWTSSDLRVIHKFPITMRTRPTLSGGTASNYTWLIAGSTGNPSSISLDFADENAGLVVFGVSGRSAGQTGWVTSSGTAGTLDFSAEL